MLYVLSGSLSLSWVLKGSCMFSYVINGSHRFSVVLVVFSYLYDNRHSGCAISHITH